MANTKQAEKPLRRLVENGSDITSLSERFFVVDDSLGQPDRYLIVRREADYAASVVARFMDCDFAHFCAKQLSAYTEKYRTDEE